MLNSVPWNRQITRKNKHIRQTYETNLCRWKWNFLDLGDAQEQKQLKLMLYDKKIILTSQAFMT